MVRNLLSPCSAMGFTGLEITGQIASIIRPEKSVICGKTTNIFAKNFRCKMRRGDLAGLCRNNDFSFPAKRH
jgi:hypothetical protein